MSFEWIEIGELQAKKNGSIDPSKFLDETFELHSIPSHDKGNAEILTGREIGSSKQIVQENDVMISKIVPHIRRAMVVPKKGNFRQIASGEWIIFRSERIYPNYLRHLLISDFFNAQFMATVSGVGGSLLRARPAFVSKIKIPLPPLTEQKRIAQILDKADELRQKRQQSIEKLDELLQATFIDMFGDPVTNPKGWDLGGLEKLGKIDRGVSKHRPRGAPELLGGSHPLIQTGDVANSKGYIRSYNSTYSEIGLAQSKKWKTGTLCITIAANIANTGILTFDACFPDSVVGFIPNKESNAEFVQGLFMFFRRILDEKAPQSAQKNINLAILRDLEVPLPPSELQQKWKQIAQKIEKQRQILIRQLNQQENLFQSLQQRAFKGEL